MKQLFTTAGVLFSMTAFAQVGINNTSPKATLDITAKTTGSKPEGLIVPQLTGDQIHTATITASPAVYNTTHKGLIIYATSADSSPTGATANITAPGYYYFDGSIWQKILGSTSGDTTNDAWINDTTNTQVKLGTKTDGTARAAGTDFVINDDGKVGIGTSSPTVNLDVIGSEMRLMDYSTERQKVVDCRGLRLSKARYATAKKQRLLMGAVGNLLLLGLLHYAAAFFFFGLVEDVGIFLGQLVFRRDLVIDGESEVPGVVLASDVDGLACRRVGAHLHHLSVEDIIGK